MFERMIMNLLRALEFGESVVGVIVPFKSFCESGSTKMTPILVERITLISH